MRTWLLPVSAAISWATQRVPLPQAPDLAAVGVEDAHEHLRQRVARSFQQHQLVAADAGVAVGKRARRRGVDPHRIAALVEHDEIIAEPVHLAKRNALHAALIWRRAGSCPTTRG